MATSRDIQEIITKLSSEKSKTREDGIKLLNSWLEGERSFSFCNLLSQNTAKLRPKEIPPSETWPFLTTLLVQCITKEISASKRRPPKPFLARTLRNVIQRAEDIRFMGKTLLLLSAVKPLFNHIWDVIREVQSFQSEYSIILRHLLAIKEYRILLKRRVYCNLVLLYMSKVEKAMNGKKTMIPTSKEEVFRYALTLHSLLENPPGDFPANLREEVVKGIVAIFSHLRDEGKILRKLIESVNVYLLKDGPNLGCQSLEIHSAIQTFMTHCWLTTHDRGLKNALILYARIQLKLCRAASDGNAVIEQLLDVLGKELDQGNITGTGMAWNFDTARDDKVGRLTTLASSDRSLMELAACVLYQACVHGKTSMVKLPEKRSKVENTAIRLKEGLMKGKWLWNGAFCFLIHNYHIHIPKTLIICWFEGICESFERILNEGFSMHAYDGPLWVLRSLQELTSVSLFPTSKEEPLNSLSFTSQEELRVKSGWHSIWSNLIHWLPVFSNVNPVADEALKLLGRIISKDLLNIPFVPQDVWDLRIFKHSPSACALYFITCYFSRSGCQGSLPDVLYLRQNLLRVILRSFNLKETFAPNKPMVALLPAAIFSVCAGCVPFDSSPACPLKLSIAEVIDDWIKIEDQDQGFRDDLFSLECSVDVLANIDLGSSPMVIQDDLPMNLRLPRQIRQPLLYELEDYLLVNVALDQEIQKMILSDLFFLCGFMSNCIYGSVSTRARGEKSVFFSKMLQCLLELLEYIIAAVEKSHREIQSRSSFGSVTILDLTNATVSALQCFTFSPLLSNLKDSNTIHYDILHDKIPQSINPLIERLLLALSGLFEEFSKYSRNVDSETFVSQHVPSSGTCTQSDHPLNDNSMRIVDVELDLDDDTKDTDVLAASVGSDSGISAPSARWKLDMVSLISGIFPVLPGRTWEIMFDLLVKETDVKVQEHILYSLCKFFPGFSARNLSDLVNSMDNLMETSLSLEISSVNILSAIQALLKALLSSSLGRKNENAKQPMKQKALEQDLGALGDLINRVAEIGLLEWSARVKLIDCICNFVLLDPCTSQAMTERLFALLQDADFRVRLCMARHVSVLFRTWDGHDQLFQDVCSNFAVKLVMASKGRLVTEAEVLDAGVQSQPMMETAIVTLAHLAFVSEKVELEAVFMICVIAATDSTHRKLVYAILDDLSRKLQYKTRSKYLEELLGSILSCWVACRVALVALVEIRDLFVLESEPKFFIQYCCPWLLPALILSGNINDLNWLATVSIQPLAVLARKYFVPIFAACMALHCSNKPEKENGANILRSSILHIAELSEHERDSLIKKHMVSVVSCLFSLCSSDADPAIPFFPKDTIVLALQTIVDGFSETDCLPTDVGVVDKINIFRPDRVFMFLVKMHYQIAAAVHPRHRCYRLSGIEVLVHIIGHRAAVSSTSCYLFNLIGQYIGCQSLQDQCCCVLSTLLNVFRINSNKDSVNILGEQLQFLVSKLVACCIPLENDGKVLGGQSSNVISLLHQLTVDADESLYDYIRELEPFPELDCFERIRLFHQDLCKAYSAGDHFKKFVQRTCYLPPSLRLWSLKALHKKLLVQEIIETKTEEDDILGDSSSWHSEPEIVSAVWALVGMCGSSDARDIRSLMADFISRVGVGDPHRVVFYLSKDSDQKTLVQPFTDDSVQDLSFYTDIGISDELLIKLLRLLKKYLMDDSVTIIDMTAQALRGLLSTERGQRALLSFDSYDRSLLSVHSKGSNSEVVERLLSNSKNKCDAEAIPLEDSTLWQTQGKTFEMWICPLVFSLINHTDDMILRLCQDVVSLKAEVAEILFPSVLTNLAGRKDSNLEICQLISLKVQENIFLESNGLVKSIQVMLEALNTLRVCHVTERAGASSVPVKKETPKRSRSSSSSNLRSPYDKSNGQPTKSDSMVFPISLWQKVYWLSIDYLVVAKSAIYCGSYFTSVMYVEHWCEENFGSLTLGNPDFSHHEMLPSHIEILVAAVTQINDPDSIYGIIQSHKLASQIITFEHEGNWSKALENYDLLVRTVPVEKRGNLTGHYPREHSQGIHSLSENETGYWKSYKGLMRSLQQTGCTHLLDVYCQGLISQKGHFQQDSEFIELQYEAAWRAGNWDFSVLSMDTSSAHTRNQTVKNSHFHENLHSCLRALQDGECSEFEMKLIESKQDIVLSLCHASKESTESIYLAIVKLQILDHLGMAWDLRWKPSPFQRSKSYMERETILSEPIIPDLAQLEWLNKDWGIILKQMQLHLNLLEPFIAFRRVLLQIISCKDCTMQHLVQSASTLRKGARFSLAAAALHELKLLTTDTESQKETSYICPLGRIEEAKLLRAQGQHEMAINLARYILDHYQLGEEVSNVHRLVGKWLAESRSSNSRTILERYLKQAVELIELNKSMDKKVVARQCRSYFHLAHYADALFRSYEERLASNEWQAAMRLRKHKTREFEALIKRVKNLTKGEKTEYSVKILELQKQLAMDKEEADKLQDDKNNFLSLALEGYQRCLVIGDKYDIRVVFRLVSLWFSLSSSQSVITRMLSTVKEIQSYKFIPLVYQIASRMGSSKDAQGSVNFQFALVSLVKKMAIDHPYHTIFQLLALANGDRVKDKQRSRNSFVVDMDKKHAAENLLNDLTSYHGSIIRQMKQVVEIYIKLAELETKKEDTNKKIALPRDVRSIRQLELVPVVTATFPVDRSCQYKEGSFPHFMGLADSITVMNGINAPKVIECFGSDGHRYRQLAKSGNDDLRQDAVMEQFFGLVNTFLGNHRDTWKRRISIRTYKVVPFTPSAGVLEWVDRTVPLGDYLLGSTRNGGAHVRYGKGDWSFPKCREYMTNEKDKRKAFEEVCDNFRPVMHYFFLEKFLQPAQWFENRLSYTRSVAASSMVGYIVGLGDRHSMNILIDQATAEVVHIDLGVAFEQGLMLKTPERVPFRLTRDIVDGMGVSGVEGVFRRCCEETLSVMRANKEALLTIIEVFIHDPLYKWALSPLKALQRQKETDYDIESSLEDSQGEYEGNKDAARALMRVKQKLDGYEEGEMRSVQGQVQQLIQDAVDTERMCQMFPGWGAWL